MLSACFESWGGGGVLFLLVGENLVETYILAGHGSADFDPKHSGDRSRQALVE